MKIMRDFECPDCGVFERYVDHDQLTVACDCGEFAMRKLSAPTISLEGISGDFPGAHDRWAKIREDNARIKAKRES